MKLTDREMTALTKYINENTACWKQQKSINDNHTRQTVCLLILLIITFALAVIK